MWGTALSCVLKNMFNTCFILMPLAEFACTVADNHVDDDGFLAVFCLKLLNNNLLEVVYQFVSNEVDGAAAEAATTWLLVTK